MYPLKDRCQGIEELIRLPELFEELLHADELRGICWAREKAENEGPVAREAGEKGIPEERGTELRLVKDDIC